MYIYPARLLVYGKRINHITHFLDKKKKGVVDEVPKTPMRLATTMRTSMNFLHIKRLSLMKKILRKTLVVAVTHVEHGDRLLRTDLPAVGHHGVIDADDEGVRALASDHAHRAVLGQLVGQDRLSVTVCAVPPLVERAARVDDFTHLLVGELHRRSNALPNALARVLQAEPPLLHTARQLGGEREGAVAHHLRAATLELALERLLRQPAATTEFRRIDAQARANALRVALEVADGDDEVDADTDTLRQLVELRHDLERTGGDEPHATPDAGEGVVPALRRPIRADEEVRGRFLALKRALEPGAQRIQHATLRRLVPVSAHELRELHASLALHEQRQHVPLVLVARVRHEVERDIPATVADEVRQRRLHHLAARPEDARVLVPLNVVTMLARLQLPFDAETLRDELPRLASVGVSVRIAESVLREPLLARLPARDQALLTQPGQEVHVAAVALELVLHHVVLRFCAYIRL